MLALEEAVRPGLETRPMPQADALYYYMTPAICFTFAFMVILRYW